ncbi:MAG: threonine synthase [Bacteroidota bacterium]|nr:threonine synthase [Bacteroidota bacterium]MDE2834520.1 threonine synthase [Bacteroidota bacterium]MDE2957221.1 threonine synthase [Bacteroidota bacterium]
MQFVSTRRPSEQVSFKEALLRGLAPDGGLYVPTAIPSLPPDTWELAESFADLARRILTPWLEEEIAPAALDGILRQALDFPVPTVKVGEIFVLELFHGPTLSFKDYGARTMARLMNHFCTDEQLTILVATSGDTGSAVADGFAGQPNLRVAVLYPSGQVSPLQEKQLTVKRPGVRTFAVEGTFDDCQAMVKSLLTSPGDLRLSAANSINVGRLLPQMLYYFWACARRDWHQPVICVPCGNLGNLTAGVLAHLSGLPVGQFLAAHNANDGFPRFLAQSGVGFRDSVRTLSNAMDVGRPSNFERLQWLLGDTGLRALICGHSVSDATTLESMRRVYEAHGYIADPHTAVALEAVQSVHAPVLVLATAHPAKFADTVQRALGRAAPSAAALEGLRRMPYRVTPMKATARALRNNLRGWA